MVPSPNHIVSFLQTSRPGLFGRGLKQISFARNEVAARAGDEIRSVYLPHSGMLSSVVDLREGDRVETASIGRNSAVGTSAAFGSNFHLHHVVANMFTTGWMIDLDDVVEAADHLPAFRSLLFKVEQHTSAQAHQIAVCNACHTVAQRFCSWLLRALDESGASELQITQEYIAELLGVQRASISTVASRLQRDAILQYRRGHVCVLDRPALEQRACECHAVILAQYWSLFRRDTMDRFGTSVGIHILPHDDPNALDL